MYQPHTGVIQCHKLNDAGADQAYFIGDVQKAGSKTLTWFRSNPGGGVLEFGSQCTSITLHRILRAHLFEIYLSMKIKFQEVPPFNINAMKRIWLHQNIFFISTIDIKLGWMQCSTCKDFTNQCFSLFIMGYFSI